MVQRALGVMVAVMGILFTGCCAVQPPKPLPAPISLEQQLDLLNARAHALAKMTIGGTLVIRYKDEHGNPQQQSVDGRLLIAQHYGPDAARDPGDVYLEGRVMSQTAFTAGKNQTTWWFMVNGNSKTAWVGEVNGSADVSSMPGGILRADLLLQALAITPITPAPGQTVAMVVNDDARSNDLLIVQSSALATGTGWVKRIITVDRDSGDVREVDLLDRAGICIVRAELNDYRPIYHKPTDDVPAPPQKFTPPRFPHDIWITYRAADSSIHFTITGEPGKKAELWDNLPEIVFQTPDFTGYKVIAADQTP